MIADGLWVLGHRKVRAVRIRRELSLPSLCSGTRTTVFEPGFGFMGSRLQGGGLLHLRIPGKGQRQRWVVEGLGVGVWESVIACEHIV